MVMREPAAVGQALPDPKSTGGLPRIFWRLVPVLIAAFGASTAQAGSGPALACSPVVNSSQSLWAAADFDGDKSVDLARVNVRRAGNRVLTSGVDLFAFCKNPAPPIFDSFPPIGLVLSARDIDADHDQDLVLRDRFAGEALGVWLNDGMGGFSETDPSVFPGAGGDPPSIQKRASPFHQRAVSSSSKAHASITRSGDPSPLVPESPRREVEPPAHIASGWRNARQSRAPPLPSC